MVEQIMFFALGALAAALATIALLPSLWRRAVRLTRARLEATLPLSPQEIAAERDQLRARFAVDIRRTEDERERAVAELHRAKADIGDRLATIHARDTLLLERAARISALEADQARAFDRIAALETDRSALTGERDNLVTNLNAARTAASLQDQELTNARQLADQRLATIGEFEQQVESLRARLADTSVVIEGLQEDALKKAEDLRRAARQLREQASERQTTERRLAAAETNAQDRAAALENLQAERLRLIEETGRLGRERDHERVERSAAASAAASLAARVADLEATLAASRTKAQQTIADLSRAADQLREERRVADEELSSLRFTKARLETDLARFKRKLAEAAPEDTTAPPVEPVQPRPT